MVQPENLKDAFGRIAEQFARSCMLEHGFESPVSVDIVDAAGVFVCGTFLARPVTGDIKMYFFRAPFFAEFLAMDYQIGYPIELSVIDRNGRAFKTILASR